MEYEAQSIHQSNELINANIERINLLSIDEAEGSYLKKVELYWNTKHDELGIYNYGVPPNMSIVIIVPKIDKKIYINLYEVSKLRSSFLSEIELKIENYTSYYQVYLNSIDLYPNSFIECKKIEVFIN